MHTVFLKTYILTFLFQSLPGSEVPLACEGDVHVVPEDGLPAGEASGRQANIPQHLLPMQPLQHQAQVRNTPLGTQ